MLLIWLKKDFENPICNYKDCFRFVIYRNPKPACYLGDWRSCFEIEKFCDYMIEVLEEKRIFQVIYSIWQSTDRCTLKKECFSTEDFIDELCTGLKTLLPHNFIVKNQLEYIFKLRNNLREDEALLQCNFSENYAYVVQNVAQVFHYNNDQCTVHPSIFYYRSGIEIEHSLVLL